ncbi:hypothetical protein H1385_003157 [Salmonella enterica]|uniref:hypothetical protein n=1 Tax=Salmonella enterica TaxID=28901 RepID=UPI000E3C767C|nr:hypothetical protein [Salmonella enterica]EAO5647211.1 hypothetical protein [Salmonella enterica subsp. enterica]EAP5757603.1 hypothetical protein [Salmonella enterica subsp. enterica serovar Barranquilla]EAA7596743.1 hypothetical protein [Salmonella enterica]EAA8940298.1 hypothetical protein [Salmonella enterica]EAN3858893.1 hypothetical protein [Salmonella enterica]
MNVPLVEQSMKMTFEEVINFFNNGIKEAEIFLCLARSSQLQLEQCLALDLLLYTATRIKHEEVHRGKEDNANLFLGFECAIGAVRSELMMWILLKLDMPNEAWDQLVAAQMGCLDASRAHRGFAHCEQRREVLEQLEDKIFPPQVFISAGFVSDRLDCSICGERYSQCEHLRGKPYMGQFCEVIHRNLRGDHVALVEAPEDKRCRVVSVKIKDGYQDKLSMETTPFKEGELFKEGDPLETKTVILALDRYPYLASTEKILGTQFPALKSKSELNSYAE